MDTKIFKKIITSYRERIGSDPYLDWWLICLVNAVGLLIIVGWGVVIYRDISQGNFYEQPIPSIETRASLNRANLTKITEMFKERAVKSEQLQSQGVFTQDPSL